MTTSPTTSVAYLRPLLRLLDEAGQDAEPLLARHGLDRMALAQAEGRVSAAVTRELMEEGVRLTGEPALGLALIRHAEYTTFGGLGLALAAGGSIRAVLGRIVRFHSLISDTVALRLEERDDELVVTVDELSDPSPHPQSLLFLIAVVVGLGRLRLPGGMTLNYVQLREVGPACVEAAAQFFRCPIRLGSCFQVSITASAGNVMLEGSDPEMAAMLEQTLNARLVQEKPLLSVQLALWLEQRFPEGEPPLVDAARALNLSERSLQRRLRDEGLTWSRVVEDTRKSLVERHLHAPGMSLTQLAFLLGFSDVSSFSRAFRKWYGVPASQYRNRS